MRDHGRQVYASVGDGSEDLIELVSTVARSEDIQFLGNERGVTEAHWLVADTNDCDAPAWANILDSIADGFRNSRGLDDYVRPQAIGGLSEAIGRVWLGRVEGNIHAHLGGAPKASLVEVNDGRPGPCAFGH